MKNATIIRTQFGLTQSEMANYLQISRSQLTMFEQGRRELPTQAFVKLAQMELFLIDYNAQPEKPTLPHEASQLQKAVEIVAKHQKELEYQQMVLKKALEKIQNAYQQNINLMQFISHLEAQKSDEYKKEKSWLQLMKSSAKDNIEKNGLHEQAKLKLQLQMKMPKDQTDFIRNLKVDTSEL